MESKIGRIEINKVPAEPEPLLGGNMQFPPNKIDVALGKYDNEEPEDKQKKEGSFEDKKKRLQGKLANLTYLAQIGGYAGLGEDYARVRKELDEVSA